MSGVHSPVILGVSLKLYLDLAATVSWAQDIARIARSHPAVADGSVHIFVLPSLPALHAVQKVFADTEVVVGAQDLFWADRGPFTGGVSGTDLRDLGCRYVEIGHAERRLTFGEGRDVVRDKFAAAVRNGLTPVLCVGETHEGSAADAAAVCIEQLDSALSGITELPENAELIVAYEPEWAIGNSAAAPPDHVAAVAAEIRSHLAGISRLRASAVIYGGSAKVGTLTGLGPSVNGLFLGRFAHDPAEFSRIVDEATALSSH